MADNEPSPLQQRLRAFLKLCAREQETYLKKHPTNVLEFIWYLTGYCNMNKVLGVKTDG